MVNPALFSLDPASWPEWGERHVQAVRDRMASIQGLPDVLRAAHGGLFAGFTLINSSVLAWTALLVAPSWPELIAPLVQLAMPFARQSLRRSCGWIAGRVVRCRLRPLTEAWHAEGPVVKARIEEERMRRRTAPGASES